MVQPGSTRQSPVSTESLVKALHSNKVGAHLCTHSASGAGYTLDSFSSLSQGYRETNMVHNLEFPIQLPCVSSDCFQRKPTETWENTQLVNALNPYWMSVSYLNSLLSKTRTEALLLAGATIFWSYMNIRCIFGGTRWSSVFILTAINKSKLQLKKKMKSGICCCHTQAQLQRPVAKCLF